MRSLDFLAASAIFLACALAASADDVTFQSGPERTHLLELYTSEGCSSCPRSR